MTLAQYHTPFYYYDDRSIQASYNFTKAHEVAANASLQFNTPSGRLVESWPGPSRVEGWCTIFNNDGTVTDVWAIIMFVNLYQRQDGTLYQLYIIMNPTLTGPIVAWLNWSIIDMGR